MKHFLNTCNIEFYNFSYLKYKKLKKNKSFFAIISNNFKSDDDNQSLQFFIVSYLKTKCKTLCQLMLMKLDLQNFFLFFLFKTKYQRNEQLHKKLFNLNLIKKNKIKIKMKMKKIFKN